MLKSTISAVLAASAMFSLTAFDLVKDGVAQFTISAGKTPSETKAVSELSRIIKSVTGADIQKGKPVNKVVIGTPATNPEIAKEAKFLGLDKQFDTDVISIKFKGNTLYAAGNNPRSAMFAVFEVLEQLGCRWFFDGPDGEYLPEKTKNLILKERTTFSKAAFPIRYMSYHATRKSINRSWFLAHNKMNTLGDGHKFGFIKSWGGHSFNWFFPEDCKTIEEYFRKYPEQFALRDGIRMINQHCYTNPKTIETFLKWMDNFWKTHPDIESLALSARDTPIYCKCTECSKYDSSTLFFNFVKKLVVETNKKHPGKKYSTIAYSFYLKTPKTDLKSVKNLTVFYCMYNRCFKHLFADQSCPVNPRAVKAINDWKATGIQPGLYGYHFDVFSGKKPVLTAMSLLLEEELRWMQKQGVKCWYTENYNILNPKKKLSTQNCFVNRFPAYVIARLTWDPSRKVSDLLKEFCKYSFGPAAKEMEQYYTLMQKAWMENGHVSYYHSNPASMADFVISQDLIRKVDALFKSAVTKAKKSPRALKMVTADQEAWHHWRDLVFSRNNWKAIAKEEDQERIDFLKKAKPGKVLYSPEQKRNGLMETCTIAKDSDGTSYIAYKPVKNAKKHIMHDGWLFGNHPRNFINSREWINYETAFSFRFPGGSRGIFMQVRNGGERFGEKFDSINIHIHKLYITASYAIRKEKKKVQIGRIRLPKDLASDWHKLEVRTIDTRLLINLDGKTVLEGKIPLGKGIINIGSYEPLELKDLTVREIPSPSLAEQWMVKVPYVKTAPVIDGKGDDAIWKQGYRSGRFTSRNPGSFPTYATVMRTDKAMYIKVECMDDMSKLKATRMKRDDGQYQDPCVELFIDPNNTRTDYYYLVINAAGVQYDAMASVGMNINLKWNGKWKSVVGKEKDRWILELELPFSTFGEPKADVNWLMGINRTGNNLRQSWTDASYHNPASFRTLDVSK